MTSIITGDSPTAQAVKNMKLYDPEFDLVDLNYELEEIFLDFYDSFLLGDLEHLNKYTGEAALAVIKTEFKIRKNEGWEYDNPALFCSHPIFTGAMISNKVPTFSFTISGQHVQCKIDTKTGEIKEGTHDDIVITDFRVAHSRHDEPDIAETGLFWMVTEFMKLKEVALIV